MYGRDYQGKTLNFEASGGLIHSSLVMQDFETDSYWAIMTGASIAGVFKGTKLQELPIGKKVKWKDWVKEHPNTLILSVRGREDGVDVYRDYFYSPQGFGGERARDSRLRTKEPIFAFRFHGKNYAVKLKSIEGGRAFDVDGTAVFFYRPKGAKMFHSTLAFASAGSGFSPENGQWQETDSGCIFNPGNGRFEGEDACVSRLDGGFDTFWYNWSLANPETVILK